LYSFSGSITITSVHNNKYLKISNLVAKDLPAPDVAKIMLFELGRLLLNLSKITSEDECKFTQYKIQLSAIKSLLINGKLPPSDVDNILL